MKLQKMLIAISVLLIAGLAFAEGKSDYSGNHMRFMNNLDKMQKKLSLTNNQVNSIKGINGNYESKFQEQRRKMQPLRAELKQLMREENLDMRKIRAKLVEISNTEIDQKMMSIEYRTEIQKILTPDQKKKLSEGKKSGDEKKKDKKDKKDKKNKDKKDKKDRDKSKKGK